MVICVGKALVDQPAADLEVKRAELNRHERLSDLARTPRLP
jgi:hypothetical protein